MKNDELLAVGLPESTIAEMLELSKYETTCQEIGDLVLDATMVDVGQRRNLRAARDIEMHWLSELILKYGSADLELKHIASKSDLDNLLRDQ